ncbi:hypothetical protein [Nostoc flagelliforme]|uniref:hypothetical protein n=1 Tax=Nostoc flagelliforme TaxID=1306274 RepID=UPI0012FDA601
MRWVVRSDACGGQVALPYPYGEASYAQRLVEKCGLRLSNSKSSTGCCDRGDFGENIFHGHNSKIYFLHDADINASNKTKLTIKIYIRKYRIKLR